jgi:hypothetical protein
MVNHYLNAANLISVAEPDKGKGREVNEDVNSGSDDGTDSGGSLSDGR